MVRKEDKLARFKLYWAFQFLNANTIYYEDQKPVSRKSLEHVLNWSKDRIRSSIYYHLSRGHVERCGKIDNDGKKKLVGFRLSRPLIDFFVKNGESFRPEPKFSFSEVKEIVRRVLNKDERIIKIIMNPEDRGLQKAKKIGY